MDYQNTQLVDELTNLALAYLADPAKNEAPLLAWLTEKNPDRGTADYADINPADATCVDVFFSNEDILQIGTKIKEFAWF